MDAIIHKWIEGVESKFCHKCGTWKDLIKFGANKQRCDGLQTHCKLCHNIKSKKWKSENKETTKRVDKLYEKENKEIVKARKDKWRLNNEEYQKPYGKKYRSENKAKIAYIASKYRADKLKATPKWLTEAQINEMKSLYCKAREKSLIEGKQYDIDHIVPLKSKKVCGLHVPWNLRILEHNENQKKSNKILEINNG